MPDILSSDFDEHGQQDGFRWHGTSLGLAAGSERLGASIYELPPGQAPRVRITAGKQSRVLDAPLGAGLYGLPFP